MSTILKALRRLEEQKSAATQRPLRDEVVLTPGRAGRRKGVVIAISAAIAFAMVGAALVVLFDRVPDAGTQTAEAPIAAVAVDVAAPPAPEPDVAVAEEAATEITVAAPEPNLRGIEVPPVVPIPESEADFEIVRPESKPRPFIPTMKVDPAPEREDLLVVRPGRAEPRRPVAPEPIEEEIVDETIEAAPVAHSAPVHVERTQWHPRPDRRVAWVEVEGATALREVHEGERVGPYVVRAIEPAAVLFSEGSVQVRREVGR